MQNDSGIDKYLEEGLNFYGLGKFKKAIECWNKVLEIDPDNSLAKDYIESAGGEVSEEEERPPERLGEPPSLTTTPPPSSPPPPEPDSEEEERPPERLKEPPPRTTAPPPPSPPPPEPDSEEEERPAERLEKPPPLTTTPPPPSPPPPEPDSEEEERPAERLAEPPPRTTAPPPPSPPPPEPDSEEENGLPERKEELPPITTTATPPPEPDLEAKLRQAKSLFTENKFELAMEMFESILQGEPDNLDVQGYYEMARSQQLKQYKSEVGDLPQIPRVTKTQPEILKLNLDNEEGFILSLIDGRLSYNDVFSLSNMDDFKTYRIICRFLRQGIIGV